MSSKYDDEDEISVDISGTVFYILSYVDLKTKKKSRLFEKEDDENDTFFPVFFFLVLL